MPRIHRGERKRPPLRGRIPGTNPPLSIWGPYVEDGISGALIEKRKAVRQRGVWVSARWQDGTRDQPTPGEKE